MARIDYRDGRFVGLGSFAERDLWRRYHFEVDKTMKPIAWVAPSMAAALLVPGIVWTEAALNACRLEQSKEQDALVASFKATTEFQPPRSDLIIHKAWDYKPFQKAGIEYGLTRPNVLVGDQPGLGKGQPLDSPVLTPTGWRKIGDLRPGDEVMHPRNGVQRVLSVYDRGVLPTYRVGFSDGSSTLCSGDHLWTFRRPQYRLRSGAEVHPAWETRDLDDIVQRTSGYKTLRSAKLRIPQTRALEFAPAEHVIPPYTMGVLLGDGCFRGSSIRFSSEDADLIRFVRNEAPVDLAVKSSGGGGCDYTIAGDTAGKPNAWIAELRRLGLWGHGSDDKFIPDSYLLDSIGARTALLQGLLDTDGYVAADGTVQFSSNSRALVDGVRGIVQSLGGVARLTSKISASGKLHWITTLNIPEGMPPFRVLRKALRYAPKTKYAPVRMFDTVTRVADVPIRCIKVSEPDGLYITDDFIVTHNTIQAIGIANCMGVLNTDPAVKRALVVVPASLKENWRREWMTWQTLGLSVGIAEASFEETIPDGFYKNGKPKTKKVRHVDVWPDTDVVIINYEILHRFDDIIRSTPWDILICDECHALKTAESNRTLFVLGGVQKADRKKDRPKPVIWMPIAAPKRVFLSGTPMLNRPFEFWPLVRALDPDDLGKSEERYAYRYCGAYRTHHGLDVSGATNLEELGEKLRQKFMVRRLKRDVLPELPPKTRVVVPLDSKEIRDLVAREDEIAQQLRLYEHMISQGDQPAFRSVEEFEAFQGEAIAKHAAAMKLSDAVGDGEDVKPSWRTLDMNYVQAISGLDPPAIAVAFEELALVRRELGVAKMSAAIPWIKDFLAGGEKLVLFGYHKDVVEAMIEGLDKFNPAFIYGKVAQRARQGMVDKFQQRDDCRVIIGNIHAMGVGHTLVRAFNVAFGELDWTPALIEQAEDRVCRIGQTSDKIFSFFLVANGSLDAKIAQAARIKEENIELTIG